MTNVRIDANGLAKGPVFESTTPAVHRAAVTTVDAADPAGTTGAVDCSGYQHCRFDITIGGTGLTSLDVQVLFWNPRQGVWFGGALCKFTATGKYALQVEALGCTIYLKVVSFSGTSFTLDADYSLS